MACPLLLHSSGLLVQDTMTAYWCKSPPPSVTKEGTVGEDVEMVRSLVRSYMLGEQADVAYCMTTLLAEVDRLRAELETVRDIHRPDPSALRWCEACEERIPCPTTAPLSNEGGDDG